VTAGLVGVDERASWQSRTKPNLGRKSGHVLILYEYLFVERVVVNVGRHDNESEGVHLLGGTCQTCVLQCRKTAPFGYQLIANVNATSS